MAGAGIEQLEEVDSTNEETLRRLATGAAPPFWIAARSQSRGRGRRGRSWASLSGNLFLSGAFRLTAAPARAAQLSYVGALAVCALAERWVAPDIVTVKWPNDVLIAGAKTAGVLLESRASDGGALDVVVGIGVNLLQAPDEPDLRATALARHLVRPEAGPPLPEAAGFAVVEAFEEWRERWAREGFAPIRAAWLARAAGLGRPISVRLADELIEGAFEGLDEDGALIARTAAGPRLVRAGEIVLEPARREAD